MLKATPIMARENQDLRNAGLKVTLPRVKILQLLEAAEQDEHHLSAEDIYKALLDTDEDVGLATVYRVLTQFESAGLVVRHNFEGGHSVFEMAKGEHHDHMVCMDTGRVMEFNDPIIEQRQNDIAKDFGYDIVHHSLVLYVKPKSQ
jgi:Fur family ferric uptake transcriptional regulator